MDGHPDRGRIDKEIGESLIRYLAEHPQAMDTAAGITEWWMRGEANRDVEAVGRVLTELTRQGLLEKVGLGKYAHYRLKKNRESS